MSRVGPLRKRSLSLAYPKIRACCDGWESAWGENTAGSDSWVICGVVTAVQSFTFEELDDCRETLPPLPAAVLSGSVLVKT